MQRTAVHKKPKYSCSDAGENYTNQDVASLPFSVVYFPQHLQQINQSVK